MAGAPSSAEYRRLLDDLESRLVAGGRVQLRVRRGQRLTLVATGSVSLGRDPLCDVVLRSAGVSRQHAAIEVTAGSQADASGLGFAVRDAGSRNGTRMGGLPIAAPVPLVGTGRFNLGDECSISFTAEDALLRLSIERGLDQGTLALVAADGRPLSLQLVDLDAQIRFQRGRPFLLHPGRPMTLNGERLAAGDVQLLHGDHLVVDQTDIEVL